MLTLFSEVSLLLFSHLTHLVDRLLGQWRDSLPKNFGCGQVSDARLACERIINETLEVRIRNSIAQHLKGFSKMTGTSLVPVSNIKQWLFF